MADLPGMARLDDPRGYECIALGCRSHGKRFLGSNFKQDATRHSQTPGHEKAHGGEPPDVLEGIREPAATDEPSYPCASMLYHGLSTRAQALSRREAAAYGSGWKAQNAFAKACQANDTIYRPQCKALERRRATESSPIKKRRRGKNRRW